MPTPDDDLTQLLRTLRPARNPGVFAFCAWDGGGDLAASAVAMVREAEGVTVVVDEAKARAAGLVPEFRAAWITLTVRSELHAVGLTAAVARALADRGIACNVVAGLRHDHLFVPVDRADDALAALEALSTAARG